MQQPIERYTYFLTSFNFSTQLSRPHKHVWKILEENFNLSPKHIIARTGIIRTISIVSL